MSGYFITGTDTGVGKTLVSVALLHAFRNNGHRVIGMKPVASGCREYSFGLQNGDALELMSVSTSKLDYHLINPYAFAPAIAPHLAAQQSGQVIELEKIRDAFDLISEQAELVVVEGVGGWRVPLGPGLSTEDMAKNLRLPVVLVVGMRLGCLNHALLTADAIKRSGLKLAGWVANQVDPDMEMLHENLDTLRTLIEAPLLGFIPFVQDGDAGQASKYLDSKMLE